MKRNSTTTTGSNTREPVTSKSGDAAKSAAKAAGKPVLTSVKPVGQAAKRARVARTAKPVKSDDVFHLLRDQIVSHQIAPGSRLREQELADEHAIPRAKVRDVLARLEQRGLVERIPNRGAIVVKLDVSQVFEFYEVREVLEGLLVRLATEKTDPAEWQDLVDLFAGPMQTYVDSCNYEAFLTGYALFRQRILDAASNPVLSAMIDGIYEKTQAVIRRVIILPGRAEQGLKEHRAVLEAMRRGDAQEAERCRRENMKSAREFIKRYKNFIV
ncbi:GntR family transcriptional regulator [Paraburkholderia sp.]|jgi:DNA-binding GntR family transcriptional regulator|uniref:GntR family transcriptional regulator n=1 Tax=Paraburkholderia sp. TaxID=1926495 RepID=UPI002F3E504E